MPAPGAAHHHVCFSHDGDPPLRQPLVPRVVAPHLYLQTPFFLFHPPIAHSFVFGSISFHPCPMQRNVPQLHQPCPLAQLPHLEEKPGQGFQMLLPEIRDSAEVRGAISFRVPEKQCPRGASSLSCGTMAPQYSRHITVPLPSSGDDTVDSPTLHPHTDS